jgi:hypothetical protein
MPIGPLDKISHQHFAGAGKDDVTFGRPIQNLIITTSGDVSISFDGGFNFMPICDGTHQFEHISRKTLFFEGGSWSGVGIAL